MNNEKLTKWKDSGKEPFRLYFSSLKKNIRGPPGRRVNKKRP